MRARHHAEMPRRATKHRDKAPAAIKDMDNATTEENIKGVTWIS